MCVFVYKYIMSACMCVRKWLVSLEVIMVNCLNVFSPVNWPE